MNEKKGWDLASTHSLEAACGWLGQKAEALIVLVVRVEDQAMPNRHGERLTRAGTRYILDKCVESARNRSPGVLPEVISPHSFRHSKAMHLLHAGVNLVYIRDILGHADLKTTEIYARIDGEMKRKALEAAFTNTVPSEALPSWQQYGNLLNWLQSLGR